MSKQFYFHLEYKNGIENPKNVLVLAISECLYGPFYLFEKSDRLPERHYFESNFKSAKFKFYRNLKISVNAFVLKDYWDGKRFKFNGRYLKEVQGDLSKYACEEVVKQKEVNLINYAIPVVKDEEVIKQKEINLINHATPTQSTTLTEQNEATLALEQELIPPFEQNEATLALEQKETNLINNELIISSDHDKEPNPSGEDKPISSSSQDKPTNLSGQDKTTNSNPSEQKESNSVGNINSSIETVQPPLNQPVLQLIDTDFSFNRITKISNSVKARGFPTFNSMQDEANLWLNQFEELLKLENAFSLAKEVLIDFLDDVTLDFYNRLTGYSQNLTWNDLKRGFIKFSNVYKIKQIESAFKEKYSGGKLTDYVLEKYEQIKRVLPEIKDDSKYIRIIVVSFDDEVLIKELSHLVTNNIRTFVDKVRIYDTKRNPLLYDVNPKFINFNVTDYI